MMNAVVLEEPERGTQCCDSSVETILSTAKAQHVTNDLLILAHPVRLQILHILGRHQGHVCVCDIERAVPVKQLSRISAGCSVMRAWQGLWAYYFLKREALTELRARFGTA